MWCSANLRGATARAHFRSFAHRATAQSNRAHIPFFSPLAYARHPDRPNVVRVVIRFNVVSRWPLPNVTLETDPAPDTGPFTFRVQFSWPAYGYHVVSSEVLRVMSKAPAPHSRKWSIMPQHVREALLSGRPALTMTYGGALVAAHPSTTMNAVPIVDATLETQMADARRLLKRASLPTAAVRDGGSGGGELAGIDGDASQIWVTDAEAAEARVGGGTARVGRPPKRRRTDDAAEEAGGGGGGGGRGGGGVEAGLEGMGDGAVWDDVDGEASRDVAGLLSAMAAGSAGGEGDGGDASRRALRSGRSGARAAPAPSALGGLLTEDDSSAVQVLETLLRAGNATTAASATAAPAPAAGNTAAAGETSSGRKRRPSALVASNSEYDYGTAVIRRVPPANVGRRKSKEARANRMAGKSREAATTEGGGASADRAVYGTEVGVPNPHTGVPSGYMPPPPYWGYPPPPFYPPYYGYPMMGMPPGAAGGGGAGAKALDGMADTAPAVATIAAGPAFRSMPSLPLPPMASMAGGGSAPASPAGTGVAGSGADASAAGSPSLAATGAGGVAPPAPPPLPAPPGYGMWGMYPPYYGMHPAQLAMMQGTAAAAAGQGGGAAAAAGMPSMPPMPPMPGYYPPMPWYGMMGPGPMPPHGHPGAPTASGGAAHGSHAPAAGGSGGDAAADESDSGDDEEQGEGEGSSEAGSEALGGDVFGM